MCVCVVEVAGQKGGRRTYSWTLNKAVNMSDAATEGGEDGQHAGRRGERGVFFCCGSKGKSMQETEKLAERKTDDGKQKANEFE